MERLSEPGGVPATARPRERPLWTANARVVDGEMLAKLGDGSYEVGSRARIIRDRLMAKDRFTPADLLDIQLETQRRRSSRAGATSFCGR